MPPLTLVLIGFLAILFLVILVALVLVARRRRRQGGASTIEDRLTEYTALDEPVSLQEIELSASFSERIIYPLIDSVSGFVTQLAPARALEKTRHRLELGRQPREHDPGELYGDPVCDHDRAGGADSWV